MLLSSTSAFTSPRSSLYTCVNMVCDISLRLYVHRALLRIRTSLVEVVKYIGGFIAQPRTWNANQWHFKINARARQTQHTYSNASRSAAHALYKSPFSYAGYMQLHNPLDEVWCGGYSTLCAPQRGLVHWRQEVVFKRPVITVIKNN